MEDYVYILDYLQPGRGGNKGRDPVAYGVGESEFRLFEMIAKPDAKIDFGSRMYIGPETAKKDGIAFVKRRIGFNDLTATAQGELEYAVNAIVMANEQKYVGFYNNAQGLSLKKHALEELPGLGKKTMMAILDERKKGNFKSFADLAERVPSVKQPETFIVKRIIEEISENDHKHYLFVPRDAPRRA